MTAAFPPDELRAEVRAVLRDLLPVDSHLPVSSHLWDNGHLPVAGGTPPAPAHPPAIEGAVVLADDAALDAFVRRVAALCEDPVRRRDLQLGRHGFRVAAATSTAASPGGAGAVVRVERGAVTERMVDQAAATGARLLLGPRAVLTPLARDRARSRGVHVDKERT